MSLMMACGSLGWGGAEGGWRKGPWTGEEDKLLMEYVDMHGEGRWNSVSRLTGLKRNGKSCRLRWVNYLRPDLKRGQITPHEENIIVELHARWGNRWSTIARSLPGRTDNEIKNYWRTHFKKSVKSSKMGEKAKSRTLKRQTLQQQPPPEEAQVQKQEPGIDVNNLLPELEKGGYTASLPQGRPDVLFMESTGMEHCLSPLYHGEGPALEASSEESFLWSGLWNLDDVDGYYMKEKDGMFNQLTCFYPEYLI